MQRTLLPEEKPLVLIVRAYLVHFQRFVVTMMAISSIERPDKGRAPSPPPRRCLRGEIIYDYDSQQQPFLEFSSEPHSGSERLPGIRLGVPGSSSCFYWDRLFDFGRQTWCYIYNVGQQFVHTSRNHRTSKLQPPTTPPIWELSAPKQVEIEGLEECFQMNLAQPL